MKMRTIYQKLFLTHSYFTIAIRSRSENSILSDPTFQPEYVMHAEVNRWAADPFLVEDNGKTWLFYEAVENNHGHIEVAEVLPNCSLGKPVVLLRDDCHYSYPFVFRWNNEWFMIPESSAAKEVRLYRAIEFPQKWMLQEVVLTERAVDTTVFERDGCLFLLTFLTDGKTERVQPRMYSLLLSETGAELRAIDWKYYDELRVRGAGPVFLEKDKLYRPVQINQEQRYGDAVAICQMSDQVSDYSEVIVNTIKTPIGKCFGLYVDGAHTYCQSSKFEATDLRCRDFDFWKLPRKIFHHY